MKTIHVYRVIGNGCGFALVFAPEQASKYLKELGLDKEPKLKQEEKDMEIDLTDPAARDIMKARFS